MAASDSEAVRALIEELVLANRILERLGVVDAFGHVSARRAGQPGQFLLSRSLAPGLVTAADILTFGADSEPADATSERLYLERFIHGEIYRARPDVMAVVHSHSPAIIPFGVVSSQPLRPVFHMAGFIGEKAPVFEIRDIAGEATDLLIRDSNLGRALAKALGPHAIVLMRGHGSTAVGASLRQAVYRAAYAETNARLQSEALRLGPPNYLTPGEARATAAINDAQIDRAWARWADMVRAP
jgi:HCOMODA/2-hydroxy-3-carboxy-muconic semialdehyde decarboxylase